MHSLCFGCALDVVRLLHAFEDGEAAKPLGWDCYPLIPKPLRELRILPGHNHRLSSATRKETEHDTCFLRAVLFPLPLFLRQALRNNNSC